MYDGSIIFKKDNYETDEEDHVAIVEGEWINGVPHGPCIVESEQGRGIMTYSHGKVAGGPSWFETDDGTRMVFENFDLDNPSELFREFNND
jgi:hypothetical protein